MEGAALLERLNHWHLATVRDIHDETPTARSLVLEVPGWPGHRAGQHVDIRLTAEDGYRAERSYSIASAPEDPLVTITVEHLPDGEVSPYLTQEVHTGDPIALRGPLGGYFVWDIAMGGPLLLLAGGSGIVPLMAMLRHRAAAHASARPPTRLLYTCRSPDDIFYRQPLDRMAACDATLEIRYAFTRRQPATWPGLPARLGAAAIQRFAWPAAAHALAYICGPSGFVELGATALADHHYPAARIRTERFGPSGT